MALILLLCCLVLGSLSLLLATVHSAAQPSQRQQRSAVMLAEVKRVLLGRAATDASLPGSLPCPDANGDGSADLLAGNDCPFYIGHVPYKTLGIPEPLDGAGEALWYALSRNFRDDNSNAINSDTSGDLNLTGTQNVQSLAALLFSPGSALPGQQRSGINSAPCATTGNSQPDKLCAANYLEGSNSALDSKAVRNLDFQALAHDDRFNDQILAITHQELLAFTAQRIGREVKSCLDSYAASAGRYPWAAPVTDTLNQRATVSVYYGRIPQQPRPLTAEISDGKVNALLDALATVQSALDRYAASNTSANRNALQTAGSTLVGSALAISASTSPSLPSSVTNNANDVGNAAQALAQSPPVGTVANVRSLLQACFSGMLTAGVPLDGGMALGWPASCGHVGSNYWSHWRNEVFYQVAAGAQPGGSGCIAGSTCLRLNGSGSYRAMVLVAGPALAGQAPRQAAAFPPASWLEGANLHLVPAIDFESHRSTDAASVWVNDLALCLDGRSTCP
jgi:hypothetical protein